MIVAIWLLRATDVTSSKVRKLMLTILERVGLYHSSILEVSYGAASLSGEMAVLISLARHLVVELQ